MLNKRLGSLLFLLILHYVTLGQANVYHHFPQCYAEWTDSSWSVFGISTYNYYLSGDTIVNGSLHSKVYSANSTSSSFAAAIREDNNKHIYVCCGQGFGPRDTMLYDFNLTVGNIVPVSTIIAGGWEVDGVDSVLLNTTYRRRFHISLGVFGTYLIEGIGSSMGLFEFSTALGYRPTLICFSQNGETLYTLYGATCHIFKWDTTSCIPYFPPELDTSSTYTAFTIFPNPANNEVTLHYNLTQDQQGASLNLNDAIGRLIGSTSLQNTGMNSYTIDATSLANGVYYCTLILNNKPIQRRKLIILHHK